MSKPAYDRLYNRCIKREMDILISGIGLLVLWPLFLIISIAIAIEDGFPVFYRADRGGYKGKCFRICKFRSMVKNADKIGGGTTALHDPRITKVGNFLRKTKLEGNDIIRQTTKSLINKGFREVSPIPFFNGCNLISNDFRVMIA